jgi:hypothetical protein
MTFQEGLPNAVTSDFEKGFSLHWGMCFLTSTSRDVIFTKADHQAEHPGQRSPHRPEP